MGLQDKGVGLPKDATAGDAPSQPVSLPNQGTATHGEGSSASSPEAAERTCRGRSIATVDIVGLSNERTSWQARLLSLTDLVPGNTLRSGEILAATERLRLLGLFRRIEPRCTLDPRGQALVSFVTTAHELVRHVDFSGNKSIFIDELRAKSVIRAGDILDRDTADGATILGRQKETIQLLYQRLGYDDAHVTVVATPAEPGLVRVQVTVDEGERQRVSEVRAIIDDLPDPTDSERQADLICPRIRERSVRDESGLVGVQVFSRRQADRARNNVRNYLRRMGYSSPVVEVVHELGGAMTIRIHPGRCSVVRILVRDEAGSEQGQGYTLSDDKELYDALPFGESGQFDFEEADRGREELLTALANRGFLFADVKLDWRPVPPTLSQQVENALTYRVTTGFVSQVRGISFPGSQGYAPAKLKTVIGTKAYDFFDSGGYAQIGQLLADLDGLREFYVSQGYYQFHSALGLPEGETPTAATTRKRLETPEATIYEYRYPNGGFRIRKLHGENFIYVEIPVVEGSQTRLGQVQIDGAKQVPSREITDVFGLHGGDVLSFPVLEKATAAVSGRYRNNGYFRMTIKAYCTSHQPERPTTLCTPEAMSAARVDVRLAIEEGEQADIGEVFVLGNFQTTEAVILRDLPHIGQPYSEAALFESQRRLRNLGVFTQVALRYIGQTEDPPRKRLAVVVQVVESPNRYMEFAGGLQTVNTQRSLATLGRNHQPNSAGEVPSSQTVIFDLVGHLVSSADRVALGYGQSVGMTLPSVLFLGEATYVNRNFLNTAKEFRIPLKVGGNLWPPYVQCEPDQNRPDTVGPIAELGHCTTGSHPDGILEKSLSFVRFMTLMPSYYDARLFGSDFGLRLTAPYLVHDYAIEAVDIDKFGALAELSRRFGRLATSLGTDVGGIRFKQPEEPNFVVASGNSKTSADYAGFNPQYQLIPRLTYDGTDSPLNPTRGFYLTAAIPLIQSAIKIPKLHCSDADNSTTTLTFCSVKFIKWDITGKAFFQLGSSVTLALLGHAGNGWSLEADKTKQELPPTERFRLGGQFGLRGYDDYGLRQYDARGCTKARRGDAATGSYVYIGTAAGCEQPQAGDVVVTSGNLVANGAVELRFPLFRGAGLWGSAFWDFGAMGEQIQDLHPASFRHGVGVGIRMLLSGQIPLRLDYGFPVDSRCRDLPTSSATCIADSPYGRLQWGILYSF